ncbi:MULTISPECIES: hypothetical protein [Halorhodospira]|uniref:hypothetical protein n=1 Tax=Halorhodospira TaxID=85108 RepID=UPI001EE83B07|nr:MULTISPECIES: hypothetical protein [Halorhodospira]MCG5529198.1 hypothetical protein [Halorhodospira halophila]MCG5543111.1 hypothetical protein [Halorhodospira sp. 9628]
MARTNAQRQSAFRQRHLKGIDEDIEMLERINALVHFAAKRNLERLACHHGMTQRAVLEWVLDDAVGRVLNTLDGPAQDAFLDLEPALRSNEGGEAKR